jgi:1,4-alpha-glucan branching enzyme
MGDAYLLVLHSHLPYVRGAGRWPHGEEWVHEAILGTYLPLLVALHDLRAERVPYRITIGLTPTLLEQLAHREITVRFVEYVDDQIARAERDVADAPTPRRRELSEFYRRSYHALRDAFVLRFGADVPAAFADLARSGHVEILTSGATHGYLPLLDEASVHAQLALGVSTTRRLAGVEPTGIWLPECAYRPGLETILEVHGIDHFFTDAPLLSDADVGAAGRRFRAWPGTSWSWSGSAGVAADPLLGPAWADVSRPYLVGGSGVAAIARHPEVSGQVWSARLGYPGDPAYREFHRKDDRSGLRYWRVTDVRTDLGAKDEYDVAGAAERVRAHAAHFASRVRAELAGARRRSGSGAIVATTFDSELFGHWWFEGVDWLSLVLRDLAALTATASGHLAADPPTTRIALREGSWGQGNDHSTWSNEGTEWMWRALARMSRELAELRAAPPADELRARAARQAVRELLLAQSSDWPFLVTTGQAGEYAAERFRVHAMRFARSLAIARGGGTDDEPELRTLERVDDVFPDARLAGDR